MDETYFLEKAEKYKDMIYRIALNYTRNTYDADDILQDVLMKFYTNKKPFENEEHIRNWLIRVSINLSKNMLRTSWKKRNVDLEDVADSLFFEYSEQSDLFISVMSLPEKNRIVLYLFYYEEFSVKEIASILNLNTSAVTSRLSRARKQLKLTLSEVYSYDQN